LEAAGVELIEGESRRPWGAPGKTPQKQR